MAGAWDDEDGVVVTGVGAVTPLGTGADALYRGWCDGRAPVSDGLAVCGDFDPEGVLNRREIRASDRSTQLALVAADEAVKQAGWPDSPPAPSERIGAVIATGFGGLATLEHELQTFATAGPGRLSPIGVTRMMGNAPVASMALRHGWRGESFSLVAACAAGAQAVGTGMRLLRTGALDAVAVGGADATVTPYAVAAFDVMGAVSRVGACRPYDVRRDGFVPGEGAAVMLLERRGAARRRRAPILATVAGYAATNDAHHMALPSPGGAGLARAIAAAIASASLCPRDVDYVNAHGASSQVGDRVETEAIKAAMGDEAYRVPVSSTKSAIGHLQAAAGAAEAVATILVLRERMAPPTLGLEQQEGALDLDYVPHAPVRLADRSGKGALVGLSFSFGLGGHNAAVVFAAEDGGERGA